MAALDRTAKGQDDVLHGVATLQEGTMELRVKRVAILVEDSYKALEVWYSRLHFREAEAAVTVIGPNASSYASTDGVPIQADVSAEQVRAEDFEAIIIPSGSAAEAISQHPTMLTLIYEAIRQHRLVATIVQARHIVGTAPNMGNRGDGDLFGMQEETGDNERRYELSAIIREGNLIKARLPVDLPAFCRIIVAALASPTPPDSRAGSTRLAASLLPGKALEA
jgi:protease I